MHSIHFTAYASSKIKRRASIESGDGIAFKLYRMEKQRIPYWQWNHVGSVLEFTTFEEAFKAASKWLDGDCDAEIKK